MCFWLCFDVFNVCACLCLCVLVVLCYLMLVNMFSVAFVRHRGLLCVVDVFVCHFVVVYVRCWYGCSDFVV